MALKGLSAVHVVSAFVFVLICAQPAQVKSQGPILECVAGCALKFLACAGPCLVNPTGDSLTCVEECSVTDFFCIACCVGGKNGTVSPMPMPPPSPPPQSC